jgi:hypothetical protein
MRFVNEKRRVDIQAWLSDDLGLSLNACTLSSWFHKGATLLAETYAEYVRHTVNRVLGEGDQSCEIDEPPYIA